MKSFNLSAKSVIVLLAIGAAYPAAAAIDVTKNPGCGVKAGTPQEKIERNAKIGELYYQAYLEGVKRGKLYTLFDYGCVAADATTTNWLMEPLSTAKPRTLRTDAALQRNEMKAYWKTMPDFAALPDTLQIHAWDGGVTFSLIFAGHLADGTVEQLWEINTLLINDAGKITHWEYWRDNQAQDKIFLAAFGKHVLGPSGLMYQGGISYDEYVNTIRAGAAKK